jgi:hypothetical protein
MQTTLCGDDGRFRLVLPYPTAGGDEGATALAKYQIRVASHQASVSLSEQQVIAGETLTLDTHFSPEQYKSPELRDSADGESSQQGRASHQDSHSLART